MSAQMPPSTRRGNSCYLSLACSLGSISLACGSLLQIPNTTDRISLQRGLFLTSLGFIYFVSLTDFCNKYLLDTQHGVHFRKKYHLMFSDVLEITNKIVSVIQAFFSFLVGFIVCKSTCSKSFVYASHFLMEAYGWFGTAYFMYDIWSMYKVHTQKIADKLKKLSAAGAPTDTALKVAQNGGHAIKDGAGILYNRHMGACDISKQALQMKNGSLKTAETGAVHTTNASQHFRHEEDDLYIYNADTASVAFSSKWDFLKYVITHPVMMMHHVFIGTFGLLVVTYIRGGGHCIYSYIYMMEFSTPFVSLRSILSTMGLKDTQAYIINGLTMLGTFFVCRVLMWPYVMWRYSLVTNTTFWQALVGLPHGCIISILILFLPQIYWFYLMLKGALKVFFPAKPTLKLSSGSNTILQQTKNNNLSSITNSVGDHKKSFQLHLNGPDATSSTELRKASASIIANVNVKSY